MSKTAKFLLVLVYLLLFCFLGTGCYFLFSGIVGPGLFAIGVFLFGGGFTGLLQISIANTSEAEGALSAKDKKPQFTVSGMVARTGDLPKSEPNACVLVCEDELLIQDLYPTLVSIPYKTLKKVVNHGKMVSVEGAFSFGDNDRNGTFEITAAQPLQGKALFQWVSTHVRPGVAMNEAQGSTKTARSRMNPTGARTERPARSSQRTGATTRKRESTGMKR